MLLFLVIPLLFVTGTESSAPLLQTEDIIPGQYIVKIKSHDLVSEFREKMAEQSLKSMQSYGGIGHVKLLFSLEADPTVLVFELDYKSLTLVLSHPAVDYVEEDGTNQPDDDIIEHPDTYLQTQPPSNWGLDRINQEESTLDRNVSFFGNGFGVNIYVIDSGINDLHRDFECRALKAFDVFGSDGRDCKGHGTQVAGVAASKTWGVAKAASIHSVRTLDCRGIGRTSDMAAAIDWVTANAKAPCVATLSFSRKTSSLTIDNAVKGLAESGCLPVAAGTNNVQEVASDFNACTRSPARSPYAITVGAIAWSNDEKASFTRFGVCLDIFAPGHFIRTTSSDGNYVTASGTSLAVPFVAGVAALHLASGMSTQDVRKRILEDAIICTIPDAGKGSPNRLLYTEPGAY
ncbi:aqualysin-1-like [Patiria miniata]|uniref:Peptidase S8/S53 domain-containing protein n=1 Tax=Patiria miniata TaxID=46514 RepID=A0A914BNQ5_PATMI|nr:aqualysin-1-like [Patiria miniata]